MAQQQIHPSARPSQWLLDLSAPSAKPKSSGSFPDPPGYTGPAHRKHGKNQPQQPERKPPTADETDTLKMKKAWEVALAPAKSLPMQAIGQYMAGNSLQIFSIFMVYTLFKGPISAVLSLPTVFARFDSPGTRERGLLLVKIVYVLTNGLVLALGIWKVGKMGLLPTTRSDWLAWEVARDSIETASPEFGTIT